ncbi:MAG TPA: hypothetical protein VJN68_11560 [Burkholderiaceae bacterium]|nr:hypothetical protein [Burkholderiaceae bacterium]
MTNTLACAEPPAPVHVNVNVPSVYMPPVLSVPDVDRLPLQFPEATHEVALVVDHLSVLAQPGSRLVGLAVSVTVGRSAALDSVAPPAHVPRIPTRASSANRVVVVMGADHRHNISNSVCLQTATSDGWNSYLTASHRCWFAPRVLGP